MNRRQFLRSTLLTTAMYSTCGLPGIGRLANAGFAPVGQRTLVNVRLDGGPDFRHLFAPAYDAATASFGHRYWSAMSAAHELDGNANSWEQRWNQDYTPYSHAGTDFGILNRCGWLRSMWDQGNVAIVSNVLGSSSRDHAVATMVFEQGNRSSGPADAGRSGWGGRLAAATDSNVLALTNTPTPFCYGPDPADPEGRSDDRMLAAQDIRAMRLYAPDETVQPYAAPAVMTRAMNSYYAAKREEIASSSVYTRFFDMERQLGEFGVLLEDRFQSLPVPPAVAALYDGAQPLLDSPYFGLQLRNLYDALALNDVFGMRIASLEYQGFDTHENQRIELEARLEDIFGAGKGMHALWLSLPADARANTVFLFGGEFGRQIRANGDAGTDHGEGTYMVLVGENVNGGVYGDMFPEAELARLGDHSPQTEGLTAIDHVFGRLCDWMQPGAGDVVFPDRVTAPLEDGLDLSGLLA